eukprot:gene2735-5384_t
MVVIRGERGGQQSEISGDLVTCYLLDISTFNIYSILQLLIVKASILTTPWFSHSVVVLFFLSSYSHGEAEAKYTAPHWDLVRWGKILLERSIEWVEDLFAGKRSDPLLHEYGTLNKRNLYKFFEEFRLGRNLTIAIFGGSFTAGVSHWPWAMYLEMYIKSLVTSEYQHIDVINKAVRASTSLLALVRLYNLLPEDMKVDMIIIDYDINDCHWITRDLTSDTTHEYFRSMTEVLIRRLQRRDNSTAIVFTNVATTFLHTGVMTASCLWYPCYTMAATRRPVLDAYFIPVISQQHALWPVFECPPTAEFWTCNGGCHHPGPVVHEFFTSFLYAFFSYGLKNVVPTDDMRNQWEQWESSSSHHMNNSNGIAIALPPPLFNETAAIDANICRHFTAVVDYHNSAVGFKGVDPRVTKLVHRDACWSFRDDVEGRTGWIAEGCINSSFTFTMLFGMECKLSLVTLVSYTTNSGMLLITVSHSHSHSDESVVFDVKSAASHSFMIDTLHEKDNFQSSSSTPFIFHVNESFRNKLAVINMTLVDANSLVWRENRLNPKERTEPQKETFPIACKDSIILSHAS